MVLKPAAKILIHVRFFKIIPLKLVVLMLSGIEEEIFIYFFHTEDDGYEVGI